MNAFDFSRVIFKSIDFPHWFDVDIARFRKNTRKIKIYKKRKVEGPILRTKQHFTYKYRSTTQNIRGAILQLRGGNTKKKNPKKKNWTLSSPSPGAAAPPHQIFPFFSPARSLAPFTAHKPPLLSTTLHPSPEPASISPMSSPLSQPPKTNTLLLQSFLP